MSIFDDELIELEARAIVIKSYVQILVRPPLIRDQDSSVPNNYLQKLHDHVMYLEPLAAHIYEHLRDSDEASCAPTTD